MQALGNQIGYKVRNISHHGQPTIVIDIDDSNSHGHRFVTSYSSMDTLEGTVTITAPHDTRFEDIDIAFTGKDIGITNLTIAVSNQYRYKPGIR
jgi:hypothetical protein